MGAFSLKSLPQRRNLWEKRLTDLLFARFCCCAMVPCKLLFVILFFASHCVSGLVVERFVDLRLLLFPSFYHHVSFWRCEEHTGSRASPRTTWSRSTLLSTGHSPSKSQRFQCVQSTHHPHLFVVHGRLFDRVRKRLR